MEMTYCRRHFIKGRGKHVYSFLEKGLIKEAHSAHIGIINTHVTKGYLFKCKNEHVYDNLLSLDAQEKMLSAILTSSKEKFLTFAIIIIINW